MTTHSWPRAPPSTRARAWRDLLPRRALLPTHSHQRHAHSDGVNSDRARRASTSSHSSADSSPATSPPSSPSFAPLDAAFDAAFDAAYEVRSWLRTPLAACRVLLRRRHASPLLAALVVLLGFLLWSELHWQKVQVATWAAEAAARDQVGTPGPRGLHLASWRARRAADGAEGVDDLWPQWWGSADERGPSPFDYIPQDGRRRRVLFLTDYADYLERMNTHTYEIVDAALRHPNVLVDVWGPGWKGYDWNVTLSANVRRRANRVASLEESRETYDERIRLERVRRERRAWWRSWGSWVLEPEEALPEEEYVEPEWTYEEACSARVAYDIVWTISDIYKAADMPHVDALDCGALLVQQIGDCHEHRCMREWYPHANNITVSKYAFELEEVFNYANVRRHYPDFRMGLFGHSPDTGNEWDFYPLPWSQRTRDAVIFGYDGGLYPIRTTVTDHLHRLEEEGRLDASPISRHPHPGYGVDVPDEAREAPLETYSEGHETYATHRALRADFARGMREARICVFDASVERKAIRKYAQALLSGCVIAGDLPTEHEDAMAPFVIHLEPTWRIERIEEEIRAYLDRPQRLHQMALDGFAYARSHLTTTRKISDMLRLADEYRAGRRGYDHSFEFSNRCRSYSGDAPRPAWCRGSAYRGLEDEL